MKKGRKVIPTRNNIVKSSPPHHSISYGDELYKLLDAMCNPSFKINSYSDRHKIPRSTTRSRLQRLDRIGLIHYEPFNTYILDRGRNTLDEIERSKNKGSKVSRVGGRKKQISSHFKTFTLDIIDKNKFYNWKLNGLDCNWRENNQMNNWSELIVSFKDATIFIKPKKVVIHLNDEVGNTLDEVETNHLLKFLEYVEILESVGIILEETSIERGHWARIESSLAKYISDKVGDKYHLKLGNGREFIVDCSIDKFGNRHLESEVTSEEMDRNLKNFLDPITAGKYDINNLKDLDKMKEVLGMITQLEFMKATGNQNIKKTNNIEKDNYKFSSYIG